MYTTIIFDFFGVLYSDPFNAWLEKHDLSLTPDMVKIMEPFDLGKISFAELQQALSAATDSSVESISEAWDGVQLLDAEMIPLIKRLAKIYRVGLLSNAGSSEIRPVIARHGYDQLFDNITVSSEFGFVKPSPEIFEHSLQQLGSRPAESIFIDDNPSNVEAATNLGMQGLVFNDATQLKLDLATLGITV